MELLKDSIWTECNVRDLRQPASIQPGMLEFNPKSVQTTTIAKFCSMMGQSQRFAILEWGLVNPEKISEFIHRMKIILIRDSDLIIMDCMILYDSCTEGFRISPRW